MTIMALMWGDVTDDVLTFIGLVLTVIGFLVTGIGAWRAKSAATRAQEAVDAVRKDMLQIDMVAEFASAVAAMKEIKTLQRENKWDVLPDRYDALRQSLVQIRSANPDLATDHAVALQSSIVSLQDFENQIDEARESDDGSPNVAKLNSKVTQQMDDLQTILTEIKIQIGA